MAKKKTKTRKPAAKKKVRPTRMNIPNMTFMSAEVTDKLIVAVTHSRHLNTGDKAAILKTLRAMKD